MKKFIKYVCWGLYYTIGIRMPKSNARISLGAKPFRAMCAKGVIIGSGGYFGKKVNIQKGAVFGSGISIGDNSSIGIKSMVQSGVQIGKDVMMGPEVYIYTQNHCHQRTDIPMIQQGYETPKPVTIGDDVWIGSRVTILPGGDDWQRCNNRCRCGGYQRCAGICNCSRKSGKSCENAKRSDMMRVGGSDGKQKNH